MMLPDYWLTLRAFLGLFLSLGSFPFSSTCSPAAGNASRWAARACKSMGKCNDLAEYIQLITGGIRC